MKFRIESSAYGHWTLTDGDAVVEFEADPTTKEGVNTITREVMLLMGPGALGELKLALKELENGASFYGPTVEELRQAAAVVAWEASNPGEKKFPVNALPESLRRFVKGVAGSMGVPPEVVAATALAVCAASVGNTCRAWINPSWQEPCVLWILTLLESGSLKTPAYKQAMRPLIARQAQAEKEYREAMARYDEDLARYDADYANWKKSKGMGDPPVKPEPPAPTDFYTSDSTVEAVAMMMKANPRGLLLARDELSGFLGSFGAYKQGRGGDESAYLEMYTGGSIKVNRAGGKRIFVPCASLSITGTVQPAVFDRAIRGDRRNPGQIENGLAARFLITSPIMPPKTWNEGTLPAGVVEGFADLIGKLFDITLLVDDEGNVRPVDLPLTTEAQKVFADFVNELGVEKDQIEDAAFRYHVAKIEGAAARLALVVHLVRFVAGSGVKADGVDTESIKSGIELARYFMSSAKKVYDGMAELPGDRELVELIRAKGGTITERELRDSSRRYRVNGSARAALLELVEAGLGRWVEVPPGPKGGRPVTVFELVTGPITKPHYTKRSGPLTPAGDSANEGIRTGPPQGTGENDGIRTTTMMLLEDDRDYGEGNPDRVLAGVDV